MIPQGRLRVPLPPPPKTRCPLFLLTVLLLSDRSGGNAAAEAAVGGGVSWGGGRPPRLPSDWPLRGMQHRGGIGNDAVPCRSTSSSASGLRRRGGRGSPFAVLAAGAGGTVAEKPSTEAAAEVTTSNNGTTSDDEQVAAPLAVALEPESPPEEVTAAPDLPAQTKKDEGGGGGGKNNPVVQLGRYVWDSAVRFKDGTVQLYTNHQECNAIRRKSKTYLSTIPKEIRQSHPRTGLTYDEYAFLQKGREDRGKVGQLLVLMVFQPNLVPYGIMFFPNMLPSPFARAPTSPGGDEDESAWIDASQGRAHAVIRTLIDVESGARGKGGGISLNPFGKGAAQRAAVRLGHACDVLPVFLDAAWSSSSTTHSHARFGRRGGAAASPSQPSSSWDATRSSSPTAAGARRVLDMLRDEIYTPYEPQKNRTKLYDIVPKPMMKGLAAIISGGSGGVVDGLLPAFFARSKVLEHIRRVTEADDFLVNEGIHLQDVGGKLLVEACGARCIGNPGATEEELRGRLREWLDLAVVEPGERVRASSSASASAAIVPAAAAPGSGPATDGEEDDPPATGCHYNGNLARAVLMGYNAVEGARDGRCSSRLPRFLYQPSSSGMTAEGRR